MASGAELSMLIRGRDDSAAAFNSAKKSLEGFAAAASTAARQANASLGTISGAARSTASGFSSVASVSRSTVASLAGVSGAARATSGSLTALGGVARSTVSGLQSEVTKLAKVAAGATLAATAALSAGLGASVKQAADFEKTISGVAAVSGASAAQIKELSALALKLGADTSFSATEAAQGIEELVKAGVSMGDVMGGAAKASLDLAAAGGISVAESATIASNAMNAFSIKGADMGRVADLIAGAANASAIDVGEFGFALQASGAVAAAVGMSFDDLSVAIAEMGQAGIKGSDGGTSLKTFLMGLQPQTKEQTKLFRELGLMTEDGANKFFDASGKVKSMADVQGILQDALKGMTDQQRIATMQTLFGTDAVRAAAVLSKSGAAGFREMADAMGKVSAASVADKRLDNLSGSVEKFKGSLSTAAITIGTGFLPSARRVVDMATDTLNAWMPAITAFSERIPAAMDRVIARAIAFGPTVAKAFTELGQVVGRFAGIDLDGVADGWQTWLKVLFLVKDVGLGAISDLIDNVALLINLDPGGYGRGWETLMGVFMRVAAIIRSAVGTIVSVVQASIPAVREAMATLLPVAIAVSRAFLANVAETIQFVVQRVLPPLMAIVQQTAGFFLGTLQPALLATGRVIRGILGDTLTWLASTVWPPLLVIAQQTVGFWLSKVLPAISALAGPLRTVLGESIQWLADVGWPALLTAAGVAADFLTGTIAPMLPGLARTIRDVLGAAITWVAETGWPSLVAAASAAASFITGTVVPAISAIVTWLGQHIPPVLDWITSTGWPALVAAGAAVSDWITGTAIPAFQKIVEWLGPKVSAVVTWLTQTGWPLLLSAAETVSDWITGPGSAAFSALVEWLGPKVSAVVKWLTETGWPLLVDAATKVSDWINATAIPRIKDLTEWLGPKLSEVVKWLTETGWPNLLIAGDKVRQMFEDSVTWVKLLWDKIEKQGIWADLKKAFDELWEAGKILVETFWPDMKAGAEGAFTPTDVFVACIKGASTALLAFATGVRTIAEALRFLREQAEKLPDWLVNGLKNGGLAAAGPAGNLIAPMLPTGGSQSGGPTSMPAAYTGEWEKKAWAAAVAAGHPDPTQFVEQMRQESSFSPDVISGKRVSSAGAMGIAQIMPGTAKAWGVNPLDPEAALAAAAKHMTEYYAQYKDPRLALGAYNAGTGNIDKYGLGVLDDDFAKGQTRDYVAIITAKTNEMRAAMQMAAPAADALGASVTRYGQSVNTADGGTTAFTGAAGDNQRALLYVIDTLSQQKFLLEATGQANAGLALDMIPTINLLEQQGTISAASALMMREMAQTIIDSGAAGTSATAGLDEMAGSAAGMGNAADLAAAKADEMAKKAAAIGSASASASDKVSDLSDSLSELPSWFTPSGKAVDAIFKPDKRAGGGPVTAGSPYIVGERGPELFVPGAFGSIVPNNALGGGGQTVVVNLNVSGSLVHETDLQRTIGQAVADQLRYGGRLGMRG